MNNIEIWLNGAINKYEKDYAIKHLITYVTLDEIIKKINDIKENVFTKDNISEILSIMRQYNLSFDNKVLGRIREKFGAIPDPIKGILLQDGNIYYELPNQN